MCIEWYVHTVMWRRCGSGWSARTCRQHYLARHAQSIGTCNVLQCVAVCCSMLQYTAMCCSVLQCVAVCCSALQCVAVRRHSQSEHAVRCSALQCVAVRCSAMQCVAVCCSGPYLARHVQSIGTSPEYPPERVTDRERKTERVGERESARA